MTTIKELLSLIELRQTDQVTFEGDSVSVGSPRVFGGQVLAQALNAAYRTVLADRFCHSLHAYFILPGDLNKPIRYRVRLVRDGGSFTTRYVTGEQDNHSIFAMITSFQIKEAGYEFQEKMPEVAGPENALSMEELYNSMKDVLPKSLKRYLNRERPITFKPMVLPDLFQRKDLPPFQNTWFRLNDPPDKLDLRHFHQVLAYTSDYNLLPTTMQPHASLAHPGNTMLASLDHAMWLHREPDDFAGWFLYHINVRSNANGRGMATGEIFQQNGKLIATVSQEGLMRRLSDK